MSNAAFLCPILQENQWGNDQNFLIGGLLWSYVAGTSTPQATFTDPTAQTPWSNPIVLNSRGEAPGEIWLQGGQAYKFVLETAPFQGQIHGVVVSNFDNVTGINDTTVENTASDWIVYQGVPTYLTSSSFSVAGDQRNIFQYLRRVKSVNNAGLMYGTIASAAYTGTVTNVTMSMDTGDALDMGLSQILYGFVETDPASIPIITNPPGSIMAYAASTPPTGYFECNGAAISRVTFAALFSVIGTTFGSGDGATTFNVPDLRGQFIRGWDDGAGVDPGRVLGSAQTSQNITHNHGINDPGHGHTVNDPGHSHGLSVWNETGTAGGGGLIAYGPTPGNTGVSETGVVVNLADTGITTQPQGGTESRPINIALMYIIKF
jgi:microcystin-dependent protein